MRNKFPFFSIALIAGWLTIFGFFSFLLMIALSFLENAPDKIALPQLTLKNYLDLFDPIYLKIFLKSIYVSTIITSICLLIGFPAAYIIARLPKRKQQLALLLLLLPFWTSSVVRTYAMMSLLKAKGLLNTLLITLGIIEEPIQILFTNSAVIIGLVYNLLPFMILPIYATLERFDFSLVEAAKDLGAKRGTIFSKIIIPLCTTGIAGGCALVFFPSMTLFYVSDLLGGAKSLFVGNLIEGEFLLANNWPRGAATSVLLTAFLGLGLLLYWLKKEKGSDGETIV